MKSFYTVNELGDVTINLSFTLPSFLGLGDKLMTKALVKIDCYKPKPDGGSIIGSVMKSVVVGSSDGGQTKTVTIAGTEFKTRALMAAPEKSMIQDNGRFVISIYSNSTSGKLLATLGKDIVLKNLAVAEEAPASGFSAVNLETEGITGDKSASVNIKIPCNKIYNQIFRSIDGTFNRIIFINHETMDNRYHIMFINGSYTPGEARTLNYIVSEYFALSAYPAKSIVTLFKIEENKYIIRIGDYDEDTLQMDHKILYLDEDGGSYAQPFNSILGLGLTKYVHELTPIVCT